MKRASGKKFSPRKLFSNHQGAAALNDAETRNKSLELRCRSLSATQTKLEFSLERYSQLYDAAPVGMISFNESGCIHAINDIASQLLGLAREDLIGQPFVVHLAREDIRKFLHHLALCRERRCQAATQLRLRSTDRYQEIFIELSTVPVFGNNGALAFKSVLIDVTARKRAETAIQENEQRFRSLIENLAEGIVLLTSKGRVFFYSASVQRLLGYTGVELSAQPAPRILHGDDYPKVRKVFERILKKRGAQRQIELRLQHKNGSWRWFSIVAKNLLHEPAVAGIVLNGRDITEQRAADLALRHNEEHFRLAQQAGRVGSFDWDIPGATCNISEICAAILGLGARRKKITLKEWEQRIHPQDRAQMRRHWMRVIAGHEGADAEYRIIRGRDHKVRWVSSSGRMYRDDSGRPGRMVGTLQDMTEIVEARRVLQQSKEQLEEVVARRTAALRRNEQELTDFFDQSPLGLLWVAGTGRVLRVNRAQEELVGYKSDEMLGREISSFMPDAESLAHILKALNAGETVKNYRTRFRRQDGRIQHVLIDANGLWMRKKLVYSRWFVRDVTDRVNLEKEILLVAERERQRIGRDLHDDLCQQLTGVEFLSQALAGQLRQASGAQAERAREIAQMVRTAITHTRELAHGLSPMRLESLGLRGAMHELSERTKKLFGIHCRFICKKPVMSDDDAVNIHLYRIAQEAVGNAIKHGKSKRIDIELSRNENKMVLTVKDFGTGMPRKIRSKGMGLRVMQYRAGVIGGTLQVEPNPEGGTIIICIAPAKDYL